MSNGPLGQEDRSACLEPETVAALVEGRLSEQEHDAARAHMAVCEHCTELLTEVVLSVQNSAEAHTPARRRDRGPVRTSGRWRFTAAMLAAAAAIALVVALQPDWLVRWRGIDEPRVEALVAAAGNERSIEGRLTGGFPYAPVRTPNRSGDPRDNLQLLAAAGEIQNAAERDASQVNLHAWGVAQVVIGRLDAAVETLESAALEGPMTARLAADLGAARLAAAVSSDRPDLLPQALESLEEATGFDPMLKEAWFTKALVLERLHLSAQAIAAWRRYLELDPSGGWSDEARARLRELERQARAPGWREFDAGMRAESLDLPSLQRAAMMFPFEFREALLRHVFLSWARRQIAGEPGVETLAFARSAVRALETTGVERLFTRALAEIDATPPPERAMLARGVVDLGTGLAASDDERIADAHDRLESGARALRAVKSALEPVASVALARIAMLQSRHEVTRRLASLALAQSRHVPSAAVEARAQNLLGLTAFTAGHWEEALQHYDAAIRACERSGEVTLAASVHVNASILQRFLGNERKTWRHRAVAGESVPSHRALQRHVYFTTGAVTASLESLPRTALLFQNEVVEHATTHLGPGPITEAFITRARMLARVGRVVNAQADLRMADAAAGKVTAPEMRGRFARARALASAEVHLSSMPAIAANDAARAAELIDVSREPMRSAEARLFQSRALAAVGRVEAARAAALRGIEDFERALSSIDPRDTTRLSAFEPVWALYSEASRMSAQHAGASYDEAFALIERGRSRMLLDRGVVAPMSLSQVRAALNADEALLMFDQSNGDLVLWWVSRDSVRVVRAAVSVRVLDRLVRLHRRAVDAGLRRDAAGGELFDLSIGQFRESFAKTSALSVIPDAAWSRVAWPVLWDRRTGAEVVDRAAVIVAPSASVALRGRAAGLPPIQKALVVSAPRAEGRPELPGARREAQEISALYNDGRMLEGASATPESLLEGAPHADVVHVAGHAVDVPSYPQLSHLLLSEGATGSKLFVQDIARADLSRTKLAVLAACGTAGQASVRGEGTVGVAWGFLTAGTRQVIATLQEIEDDPARALFTRLHKRIAKGMRPALALYEVQRELAAAGESPRVWGVVVVIGAM